MDMRNTLALKLTAYMATKGYEYPKKPGEMFIVYLEGADADGRPNADRADEWNDRRLVLSVDATGAPEILHNVAATTEPGQAATNSKAARARGGVARIGIGQHKAWRMGFHKGLVTHPALVQVSPLPVHRDYNRDGKRTGDRVDAGLFGINQHSTKPNYRPTRVGTWSEGCLVGRLWVEHLAFLELLRSDVRFRMNKDFIFSATVIDGDDFAKVMGQA